MCARVNAATAGHGRLATHPTHHSPPSPPRPATQLYNEEVNDLLAPENSKLPIHESREAGVYVAGLREDIVASPDHVLALLEEGEGNRHTGATKMNERSSRSHTLFRMARPSSHPAQPALRCRRLAAAAAIPPLAARSRFSPTPQLCTAPSP